MPSYLIDTDDGLNFIPIDAEVSFTCPHQARAAADEVLGAMADDIVPDGKHRVLHAVVRDETGQEVYVATVTFTGEWKIPLAA